MADIIIAVILIAAVGSAIAYIKKAKKNGAKCIGCPSGGSCGKCQSEDAGCGNEGSSCHCHTK